MNTKVNVSCMYVIQKLFGESTKFALIVGPDGIGKSALAQFIFSDDRINAHFDLLLWVPVLDDFDALRMSRTLLEGLICQPPCNPMEEEDASRLQARLKDALAGKNFLLVLDSNCHRNPFDPHALGILSEFGGTFSISENLLAKEGPPASLS
ncbi:hypothetical protein FEM48_Zijuj09G0201900 [Ziziphus jujuba var. spinosa]|uniref:NB-ARC domain-containing protein n=1 Tax=Ziziphus jujuba var. spinosa TaxID=714518 RepID=A0A978UV28_ZIZJJ|nr:hypothetical protein FEM48_Zijuj09G0201900 [Ziziphus jujuba var. spinosa]